MIRPAPFTAGDVPWDRSHFPGTWRLLDDVQLMELADPQFIIESVIQERSVGVLYAPPGAGKTTLLAGMLTSIATGLDWFGHPVSQPGASVYVATEDPAGFKVRLRAEKRAKHISLDQAIGVYTFPEPLDLREADSVTAFRQFLEQRDFGPQPLRVVAVDTYAAATPGASENSSERSPASPRNNCDQRNSPSTVITNS